MDDDVKYTNLRIDINLIDSDVLSSDILDDINKILNRYDFKQITRVTDENDSIKNEHLEFNSIV